MYLYRISILAPKHLRSAHRNLLNHSGSLANNSFNSPYFASNIQLAQSPRILEPLSSKSRAESSFNDGVLVNLVERQNNLIGKMNSQVSNQYEKLMRDEKKTLEDKLRKLEFEKLMEKQTEIQLAIQRAAASSDPARVERTHPKEKKKNHGIMNFLSDYGILETIGSIKDIGINRFDLLM